MDREYRKLASRAGLDAAWLGRGIDQLFVDVFLALEALGELLECWLVLRGSPSGRQLHLLHRFIETRVRASHPRDLGVNSPVVRVLLDIGAEDFEGLILLALSLELSSVRVQLEHAAHRDCLCSDWRRVILAPQRLYDIGFGH